jgi:GNAT superfamily N-acetyltransferase
VETRPFTADDIEPAAELLERRQARHRAVEPLLPETTNFEAVVEAEWGREGASGAIALRRGEPLAYLIGAPSPLTNTGEIRIIGGFAAHAADDPAAVRDLYALAAGRWVEEGQMRHAVVVPSHDRALIDTWFRTAFGIQFLYAVRETAPEPPVEADVAIRPSAPGDLDAIASLDRELWTQLAAPPSFSGNDVQLERFSEDWADTWDDRDLHRSFVAERGGKVVGHALLYARPEGDSRVPEASIDLAHAVTDPEVRGSGVGLALSAFVLRWAHEHGYRSITTDWRTVNLLAARFWPRRGWRETHLRLYRALP